MKMTTPNDLLSTQDTTRGSEFGGVGGIIAPEPHEMTPAEASMYMRAIPADETDSDGNPTSTFSAPDSSQLR
jgi:hypothetical protein